MGPTIISKRVSFAHDLDQSLLQKGRSVVMIFLQRGGCGQNKIPYFHKASLTRFWKLFSSLATWSLENTLRFRFYIFLKYEDNEKFSIQHRMTILSYKLQRIRFLKDDHAERVWLAGEPFQLRRQPSDIDILDIVRARRRGKQTTG